MSRLVLTSEQQSIIRESRHGNNMVIRAFSGSGKTLTLAGVALASKIGGVYLVFNSSMRWDAQRRMPPHVPAITGHSMAFQNVVGTSYGYRDKFRRGRDGRQISFREIARAADCRALTPLTERQAASVILETVKQFQFSADTNLGRHHVPLEKVPASIRARLTETERLALQEAAAEQAQALWNAMILEDSDTPILHDTYLKLFQLRAPKLSTRRWLCDEWQDTNPVVDAIIRQQDDAQKIYVGDPYQAIYGWRAAHDALSEHHGKSGFDTYTLSQSFRFGSQVADMATRILRARGETVPVRGVGPGVRPVNSSNPYTVIARNNLTLLDHVSRAAEHNKRIAMGVSAGEMASMVRSAYALFTNDPKKVKHAELKGYQSWQEFKDVSRVLDDGVLKGVVRMMETYQSDALRLADTILANKDTPMGEADVTLTTAHRAKGREWEQVVLADDLHPSKTVCQKLVDGIPLTDRESETVNLLYVALTRSKRGLCLPVKTASLLKSLEYAPSKHFQIDSQAVEMTNELASALGDTETLREDQAYPAIG
ncbi:MAG: Helicase, UvrD/REP family protein [Marinobacter sp. T13-3]|nr:MAG: Helicase, UvrD/REP family protein [Marinobacter sp. T13-3]